MSAYAWVTLATNDSYSLGALVLAHSLRNVGTTHQLAVLVTPGVTPTMRDQLRAVFNLVQEVNVLDSNDTSNLALLARPELGVTFTKIHCWTLTQYTKCVFMDADTMVLQNCDELFDREELSAAPDVGWPDCFNSGVFVYRPSTDTFKQLLDFAIEKGSFDGGDQGLLNMFFCNWSVQDSSRRLPFIYNMCSTAVYSYLPAFKQFGKDAKVIHFIGPMKPWLLELDSQSGQVYPSPGYEHIRPILQQWWTLFLTSVLPKLQPDMRDDEGLSVLCNSEIMGGSWQGETRNEPESFESPSDYRQAFFEPWDTYQPPLPITSPSLHNTEGLNVSHSQHEQLSNYNESMQNTQVTEINQTLHKTDRVHHDSHTCGGVSQGYETLHRYTNLSHSNNMQLCCHDISQHDSQNSVLSKGQWHHSEGVKHFPAPHTNHVPVSNPPAEIHKDNKDAESIRITSADPDVGGIAGALANLSIGSPRSEQQIALEQHWRRQAWEQGHADYLGKDAFDKIWAKIESTLQGVQPSAAGDAPPVEVQPPPVAAPPSPPPPVAVPPAEKTPTEQPPPISGGPKAPESVAPTSPPPGDTKTPAPISSPVQTPPTASATPLASKSELLDANRPSSALPVSQTVPASVEPSTVTSCELADQPSLSSPKLQSDMPSSPSSIVSPTALLPFTPPLFPPSVPSASLAKTLVTPPISATPIPLPFTSTSPADQAPTSPPIDLINKAPLSPPPPTSASPSVMASSSPPLSSIAQAPTSPTSAAPSPPTTEAPTSPTSATPSPPTAQAPTSPTSATPSPPTAQAPTSPTSATPSPPTAQAPTSPTSATPSSPTVQAPTSPASATPFPPTAQAPTSPTSATPSSPMSKAPTVLTSATPSSPTTKAPTSPTSATPFSPTTKAPTSPISAIPSPTTPKASPISATPSSPTSKAPTSPPPSATPSSPTTKAPPPSSTPPSAKAPTSATAKVPTPPTSATPSSPTTKAHAPSPPSFPTTAPISAFSPVPPTALPTAVQIPAFPPTTPSAEKPIPRTPTVTDATPPTSPPVGPVTRSPEALGVGNVTPPETPPVGSGGNLQATAENQSAESAPIPPKRRGGPSKGGKSGQKGKK